MPVMNRMGPPGVIDPGCTDQGSGHPAAPGGLLGQGVVQLLAGVSPGAVGDRRVIDGPASAAARRGDHQGVISAEPDAAPLAENVGEVPGMCGICVAGRPPVHRSIRNQPGAAPG